jgi:2-dehydropantoate 2-reductase
MKILIYGAGSLGLLFAHYLNKNEEIAAIAKTKRAKAIQKNSLTFIDKNKTKCKDVINIYDNINDVDMMPDVIFLSVKSFDIDSALSDIKSKYKDPAIFTIQNGVYAERKIEEMFSNKNLIAGSSMAGAKTVNDYTVEEFVNKGVILGSLSQEADKKVKLFADVLKKSGLDVVISDNIWRDKWRKLIYYCAGSTINSLTGTKNLEDSHLQWISRGIIDEIVRIGQHLDLNFNIKEVGDSVFDFLMNYKPESWSASVGEDLRKGKTTEIDFLNGYIVKLSEEFNIDATLNKMLYSLVKTIEKTKYFAR